MEKPRRATFGRLRALVEMSFTSGKPAVPPCASITCCRWTSEARCSAMATPRMPASPDARSTSNSPPAGRIIWSAFLCGVGGDEEGLALWDWLRWSPDKTMLFRGTGETTTGQPLASRAWFVQARFRHASKKYPAHLASFAGWLRRTVRWWTHSHDRDSRE